MYGAMLMRPVLDSHKTFVHKNVTLQYCCYNLMEGQEVH
jgi:hypothetical protein